MSTETWIACSVVFSLVLAGIGWTVQYRLTRDDQRRERQVRSLEDSLQAATLEANTLRDALRTVELVSMILDLSSPEDRTEEQLNELSRGVKARITRLPTGDEMHERLKNLEASLSDIAFGIQRLTRGKTASDLET